MGKSAAESVSKQGLLLSLSPLVMAETLPPPRSISRPKKKPLPSDDSLPGGDDPFALLAGGSEGGFLSLEEFDESEYGFIGGIPEPYSTCNKSNKRKPPPGDGEPDPDTDTDGEKKKPKKWKQKRKSRKDKKKRRRELKETEDKKGGSSSIPVEPSAQCLPAESSAQDEVNNDSDTSEELLLNDDEVYAWKELRLHPLLVKSIRVLGFKEPTPIQKACIPAAAHQGKDVIGAAVTGSGKTLAFGLPILQRLLEERDKVTRSLNEKETATKKGVGENLLRALIVIPTRELALQVCDHIKQAAKYTDIRVVPIVGGMSTEKQVRLLRRRPEIIVGTPGRLWELMSGGEQHLVELHFLSFFVLDEADRMVESGHFHELQSIIDMLPMINGSIDRSSQNTQNCETVPTLQLKKRQTFVFSATIALSNNFRKKLKAGSSTSKSVKADSISSIETLSQRAGMRADAAIIDLTNASIFADKLEESFIECREDDKEAYLYYILSVHGQGRTIVFCTSIAALRRISSLLHILGINAWTLHAQMQQRARLKAMDRFRENDNAILIATDVAARGIDVPGIRTVVHYQLPHSADVYIHRSGRTARASADGCCIALISPGDKTNFFALCNSLSKENLRQFPLDDAYMPEVMKRLSLARQIDKILRKNSQENVKKTWFEQNAESLELDVQGSDSEEEAVRGHKLKKTSSLHLKKLQQDLNNHLAQPLQPKTFSHRFLAGAGVSPLLQQQLEELSKRKSVDKTSFNENKRPKLLVIGHECIEPLQALRNSGHEVCVSGEKRREVRRLAETVKRKRREGKKSAREQKRKVKRKAKEGKK